MTGGKSAVGASKADGLDARNATEATTVTFKDLGAGESITVNGLTLTVDANKTASASDIATFFGSLKNLTADTVAASVTGKPSDTVLSGSFKASEFTSAANVGNSVTFTSTKPFSDVTALDITSAASPKVAKLVTITGVAATDASTAQSNESAYGDAVLYWNNNGTPTAINIDTVANSEFAIDQLDKAILGVATERAKYGAFMSRLEHSSDNLLNVAQNTDQSRSRIEDADYAVETSELARTQIISQASTAMLAQANQSKQSVLTLLQG
jgi:flagellin